ncbi:VOC family protein [Nonomuraea sp. NPDC059194]|uniref:VOC family protein n=1 Tax=Nonomuraea sp. NPDC059194 TaxID=3346764 RepID=UPI0036B8DD75
MGDVAASSRFFTGHLGFREVFVALSRDDGAADILLLQRSPEAPPGSGFADVIVSFAVTDIAAEYARLRAEGAPITVPLHHEPWGEWVLQLTRSQGLTPARNIVRSCTHHSPRVQCSHRENIIRRRLS